jgi:monofunctional biosynthetic peptidoglycan transglycosylase
VLALWVDLVLTKHRILEIYLNIVEWGPDGVFGAEAAARRAYHKSAASLSSGQAAAMAAALPNPIERDLRRASSARSRWAATVAARMRHGGADLSCVSG